MEWPKFKPKTENTYYFPNRTFIPKEIKEEPKTEQAEDQHIHCRHCKAKTLNTNVSRTVKTFSVRRVYLKGTCSQCNGKTAVCQGELKK